MPICQSEFCPSEFFQRGGMDQWRVCPSPIIIYTINEVEMYWQYLIWELPVPPTTSLKSMQMMKNPCLVFSKIVLEMNFFKASLSNEMGSWKLSPFLNKLIEHPGFFSISWLFYIQPLQPNLGDYPFLQCVHKGFLCAIWVQKFKKIK